MATSLTSWPLNVREKGKKRLSHAFDFVVLGFAEPPKKLRKKGNRCAERLAAALYFSEEKQDGLPFYVRPESATS